MIDSIIQMIKPIAIPISWTLIHSLWQALVIAVVLTLALYIFRRSSSRFKYILALGALGTILLGSISTYYLYSVDHEYAKMLKTETITPVTTASALIGLEEPAVAETPFEGNSVSVSSNGYDALIWLFVLWVVGVLTLTIYNFISWQWTRYFTTTLIQPISEKWQERFDDLCYRLKMDRAVRLIESKLIQSPCVIGWFKPIILVPSGIFTGFNTQYLEMILTHELAHIKNYDILINYFQKFIETLLFFNPSVWWISRKIRFEREHCCDDLVVSTYNDKLKYAHALADLEQFRQKQFGFAMAARGGSLIGRIKRLIGKSEKSNYRSGLGAVLVTAFSLMLIVGICLFAVDDSEVAIAQTSNTNLLNIPPENYTLKGYWDMAWYGDKVDIKMSFRNSNQYDRTFWYDELVGLEKEQDIKFTMVKDAGTVYFEGTMDKIGNECLGSGNCWFVANIDFIDEIAKLGYRNSGEYDNAQDKLLNLALSNMSLEYARQIKQLGHDDLTINELIKLHYHGVSVEYIAELEQVGYSKLTSRELLRMKDHGVDAYFIYALHKYGYNEIQVDELIKCKDHGVNARFIEKMIALGYEDLSLTELVRMKDHGVDGEYVKKISESGLEFIEADEMVKLRDHGIDHEFIKEMQKLKGSNLTPEELIKLHDHGVSASYIETIHTSGYANFTPHEIIKMSDYGVTGEFIKQLSESDYDYFSADEIAKMCAYGVNGDFIEALARCGYDNLTGNEIAKMSSYGVNADYIEEIKKSGYDDLTPQELIKLREYGVSGDYLNALAVVGYKKIEPGTIVKMHNYGVDADYIKDVNEDLGKKLSPEKLIKYKNTSYYN